MLQQAKYTCIDTQWSVMFLPERPNGFAIFLVSDFDLSVESHTSIWEQHPERKLFLHSLLSKGYTVYTSNLYGKHWGSEKAYRLADNLYHFVLKRNILNRKIHIFAEGMGALIALKCLKERPEIIRSAFFVNPCIYLNTYYDQEKQNRLYYKRFLKELTKAHGIPVDKINESWFLETSPYQVNQNCPPIHILHNMQEKRFPFAEHSKKFEQENVGITPSISISIYGRGKTFSTFSQPVCLFYKKYEKKL